MEQKAGFLTSEEDCRPARHRLPRAVQVASGGLRRRPFAWAWRTIGYSGGTVPASNRLPFYPRPTRAPEHLERACFCSGRGTFRTTNFEQ